MTRDRRTYAGLALTAVMALGGAAVAQSNNATDSTQKKPDAAAAPTTEDVIVMLDGRILNGQILSETPETIVFEYTDRTMNITTKLTLRKHEIDKIQRDVPLPEELQPQADAPAPKVETTVKSDTATETIKSSRFGTVAKVTDPNVPAFYIVPMKGQMGTDIHPSIYKEIVDDIRAQKPAAIIIVMECSDIDDLMIPLNEATEMGQFMHHEFREIVDLFQDELSDIPKAMWIEDSVGFSALVAMSFENMYMKSDARLTGLRLISMAAEGWQDEDVAAKMMAAWTGIAKGFLENGGHSLVLAEALMRPEYFLSASFEGRKVVWTLDSNGEYVIDTDDERTAWFRAKMAEDLGVSDGTVDSLDDLAFLLGYREYRVLESKGTDLVSKYKEDWRRMFEESKSWFDDYRQFMGWASGEETLKYLGQAKNSLQRIIDAMNRYEAVEIRWRTDMGVAKPQLEILIEQMNEQIRALKNSGRNGGGGGGGSGRGGGLGGGGRGR